jgi:hypothetical protein
MAGILIFVAVMGLIGFVILINRRLKREAKGDIFLMKKDPKDSSLPVGIRAQRDYRYKDAGVDPYEKKE